MDHLPQVCSGVTQYGIALQILMLVISGKNTKYTKLKLFQLRVYRFSLWVLRISLVKTRTSYDAVLTRNVTLNLVG